VSDAYVLADPALGEHVADWHAGASPAPAGTVTRLGARAWALATPQYRTSFAENATLVRGILTVAVVRHRAAWTNVVRRFVRDLAERRQPPATAWRRGRLLMHEEPAQAATATDCRPLGAHKLATLLADLATPRPRVTARILGCRA